MTFPLADALISIPLNPQFASLNLAQAVLLVAYEWFQTWPERPPERILHTGQSAPATKAALVNLFEHLEQELDACRFFSTPDKRPSMVRNIRNAFERMRAPLFSNVITRLSHSDAGLPAANSMPRRYSVATKVFQFRKPSPITVVLTPPRA